MKSIKKTLWMAYLFLGSLSSALVVAEDNQKPTLEWRLQQLSLEAQETERLHHLFDLYWDWIMAENPDYATYVGYPGYDHLWPNISLEAINGRHAFAQQILDVLTHIDRNTLFKEDRISYDTLKIDLEKELEGFAYQGYYMPLNQLDGIHLEAPLFIGWMPTQTVKNYENIIARLNGFSGLIDQTITLLAKGLENGLTPPKIAMKGVPKQILNQIMEDPLQSAFLQPFTQFPTTIDQSEQDRLIQDAKEAYQNNVYPALCKLYSYIADIYLPACRKTTAFSDLPNGKNWYALQIRQMTTTSLSAEEIHQIGLREVERIHQEMLAIIKSVQFEGSFAEFLQFLKTDPQFFYSNSEGILEGYRNLTKYIEGQLPKLFKKLSSLPFNVVPVPSYADDSQIGAYYYPGSAVLNRPGSFFINTSHPESSPKWEMEPLALHEAVPGHHLQISLAQEIDHLPEFRKNTTHYTAYIEGWGLYSESLGKEFNLYQDPYSDFGRLTYEMFRAIRLVVDTGLHSMGWSRQDAIDYFKEHVGMSDQEIVTEVDRYLVMPAQALAYKIGELKIKEMRQLAAQTLGDCFDIRDFHDEWLKHGALPLDIIEELIKKWLDEKVQERALLELSAS